MCFLETERLRLRNVITEDIDVIFDYRNNEICSRYQRGQTKSYDGIQSLVEQRKDDKITSNNACFISVAKKETNEMIGEIIVMPNDKTICLGYTFSYKYHRQGYAYESLSALIEILHDKYDDWEFVCFTDPDNQPSMALLTKLGYRNMGYIESKNSQMFGKWIEKFKLEEV